MEFEKFVTEIAKIAKMQPDNLFAMPIEEFSKTLKDSNQKYIEGRLDNYKKEIDKLNDDESPESASKRRKLQDAYDNAAMMIGRSDAFSSFDSYDINGMLYDWYLWTAMYISSWVFARAIDRPATDMIRAGWKIVPEMKEKIEISIENKRIRADNVKFDYAAFNKKQRETIQPIIQALKWARLYGGAVCCLLTEEESPDEYEKPLAHLKKGQAFRLLVADRWQQVFPSVDVVTDVKSADYNTPKFYSVRTDVGSFRFHHTRVLRFANGEAPDMIRRMLMGWGIPEGVRLFNEINRDEKIKNMITSALAKHSLEIIKMSGMKQYMSGQLTPEMENELDNKLAMINRFRSFNSLLFLDKDDEYQRQDGASLGTLSSLMEVNSRFVAGAIPMPQVLLYGDQQTGLSGNSFDDLMLYEDHLMSLRHERLEVAITKLSGWICDFIGMPVESLSIVFNSSLPITQDKKVDNTDKYLALWEKAIQMGLLDKVMVMEEMRARTDELAIGESITDAVVEAANEASLLEKGDIAEEGAPSFDTEAPFEESNNPVAEEAVEEAVPQAPGETVPPVTPPAPETPERELTAEELVPPIE